MDVVICVKAVSTKLLDNAYASEALYSINPYDAYSLKFVLKNKSIMPCTITCICMAPQGAKDVLVRCLAMGADNAVMLCDDCFAGADTYATSYVLSRAISKLPHDLIMGGQMAIDGETGQVMYGLAQRLGLLCIPQIQHIEKAESDRILLRYINDYYLETVYSHLPIVVSVNNICKNEPVSLFALKSAQRKTIVIWNAHDIGARIEMCGQAGSKTRVDRSRIFETASKQTKVLVDAEIPYPEFLLEQLRRHQ